MSAGTALTLQKNVKLTVGNNASLNIASGATVIVDDEASVEIDTAVASGSTAGIVTNNGTIAYEKAPTTALTTTGNGNTATAYPITKGGNSSSDVTLVFDTLAYPGETVTFNAYVGDSDKGLKVDSIAVAFTGSTSLAATATRSATDASVWSFTMPAVSGTNYSGVTGVTLTATTSGAWSVTPVLIDSAGETLQTLSSIGNLSSSTTYSDILSRLGTPSYEGKVFGGWFLQDKKTELTVNTKLAGSLTVYAKMNDLLTVTVGTIENGTVIASPTTGSAGDSVTITATPATGYWFGTLTVNGSEVTIPSTNINSTGVATYEFSLTADTTVSATFEKLYSITAPTAAPTGTSTAPTATGFTTGTSAVEGSTITVTVGEASENYALSKVYYTYGTGSSQTTVEIEKTNGTYTFKMPAEDITIGAEYGTAAVLTIGTITGGASTNPAVAKVGNDTVISGTTKVAKGATVVLTLTPSNAKTSVKSITVAPTSGSSFTALTLANGDIVYDSTKKTYSFAMPGAAATVTAEFAKAYDVTVKVDGANVENAPSKFFTGVDITFDVLAATGYTVSSVTAVHGSTTIKTTDENSLLTTPSTGMTGTWTLKTTNISEAITINVTGVKTTNYTLVLDNSDVKAYSDKACKTEITDLTAIAAGSPVYLKVSAAEGKTITSVSVSYIKSTVSSGKTTDASQTIPATKESDGVYSFEMPAAPTDTVSVKNDTVTASAVVETVSSKITAATGITNGSVSFTVEGQAATTALYGATVAIVPDADDGYILSGEPTVKAGTANVKVTFENGAYTFVMPAQDVTVTVAFTVGYSVTVKGDGFDYGIYSDANGTAATGAANGTPMYITLKLKDGYTIPTSGTYYAVDPTSTTLTTVTNKIYNDTEYDAVFSFSLAADTTITFTLSGPRTITVDEVKNATVMVTDKDGKEISTAKAGDTVRITATPASGYYMSLVVVSGSTGTIELSASSYTPYNNYVEFKMPDQNVSVKATISEFKNENMSIGGNVKTDSTFTATQIVTVTDNTVLTDGADIVIWGELIVPADKTLTLNAGSTLTVKGYADIKGNVVIDAAIEGSANASDNRLAGIILADGGEIVISGNVTISGTIGSQYSGKIIFAAGSSAEVTTGADTASTVSSTGTITGAIEVQDGASLTVAGTIAAGTKFDVSGILVVESSVAQSAFSVALSGAGELDLNRVVLAKTGQTAAGSYAATDGKITVTDAGLVYYDKDDKKATTTAVVNTLTITASATATAGESATYTAADSISYGVTVTGVVVKAASADAKVVKTDSDAKKDASLVDLYRHSSVMTVSGTPAVAGYTAYSGSQNGPTVSNAKVQLALVGADAAKTYAVVGDLTLSNGVTLAITDAEISGNITVPAGAAIVNSGALSVKTAINASAASAAGVDAAKFTNESTGSITLTDSGSIATNAVIAKGAGIDAAYYQTGSTVVTYNYVTIDAAIAAMTAGTTKDVTVYGKQAVSATATVPASATLKLDSATLTVGSDKATDVVLTIASGAKLTGTGSVVVKGTLDAERMSDIDSNLRSKISSDVYSFTALANGNEDASKPAKWTNVYTALSHAKAGETVTLKQDVTLKSSATVADEVTLDAAGKTITVDQKAVLTVAGTLDLTDGAKVVLADSTVNAGGTTTAAAGSIVYTGTIAYDGTAGEISKAPIAMAADAVNVKNVYLPGAVYQVTASGKTTEYLTTYANGAAKASSADGRTVYIIGDKDSDAALGSISFAGESGKNVTVMVQANVTGSITLSYAELFVSPGCTVDAEFLGANGSISAKGTAGTSSLTVSGTTYTFGFNVTDSGYPEGATDAKEVIGFGGTLLDSDTSAAKVATSLTVSGTVYAMSYIDIQTDKAVVSDGATLTVVAEDGESAVDVAQFVSLDVQGNLSVPTATALKVSKALTVSGAVAIAGSGSITTATAAVTGSVDAAAKDSSDMPAATFTVDKLFIGITEKKAVGADASVTGNVVLNTYAVAAAGSTVPSAFTAEDSVYKATKYVVDGADYVTVYIPASGTTTIGTIAYPTVEEAVVEGWYVDKTDASSQVVGSEGYTTVTAKINKEIYSVRITTDGGINWITIDGKLLQASGNTFSISGLTGGAHEFAYQGAAGYDVSGVKLYAADGTEASTLTLSGATKATTVDYQLIGSKASSTSGGSTTVTVDVNGIIDAINKNTEEIKNKEVSGGSSDSDDNDLTNILLVVLVILIIVMAILVAVRMMRS